MIRKAFEVENLDLSYPISPLPTHTKIRTTSFDGVVVFGLLYQQPLQYQHYMYPRWAEVLGWGLACSSILMIPLVAIYKLLTTPGTFRERLACCISPESEHEAIRGGAPVSRFSWRHWLYV
ncbi:hypothetical protein MSG28_013685 [Choristoneura fumiferana]|uniref:Uncharacterized protein n=1 Tax=Choristoneura fumiferana TaxID=7141 RepID=A0ACC0K8D8_CHOFU|nr:hypothetical protein MSG28_013685 [Choristoneura fumiferana]